jgi:outer membrane protein OmpA-like peptidoglycan-associated protein
MYHDTQLQKTFATTGANKPLNTTLEQIDDLIKLSKLAEATELARLGNYTAAEEILQPLVERQPTHALLDLSARIKAQKGDLPAARMMWERALTIQPGCPDCIAGIARVDAMQKGRSNPIVWPDLLLKVVFFASVLFVFGLLFKQITDLKNGIINTSPAPQVLPAQFMEQQSELLSIVKSNQAEIRDLQGSFGDLLQTPVPTQTPETPSSILEHIEIEEKGLESTLFDDRIQIRFSSGLFRYNWSLDPEARETLREVGAQLEPWASKIEIQVVGFTDATEKGQSELSYLRSYKVIEALTDNSTLPETIFLIAPSGIRPSPYPNDTVENRLKNRTVILIITSSRD